MKTRKQFLVLGLGSFGSSVAEHLCRMGHEVMAVDADEHLVEEIAPVVTQAVQADATDEAALDSLDVGSFDAAVVGIGSDIRASVLVAVLLKEKGVPFVAAKAVDDLHAKVLMKMGVNRVIFPERDMGQRVARSLVTPHMLDLMELDDDHQVAEVVAPGAWMNHSLVEINVRRRYGLSVIAIRRGEKLIASPGADEVLRDGDVLLLLGKTADLERLPE